MFGQGRTASSEAAGNAKSETRGEDGNGGPGCEEGEDASSQGQDSGYEASTGPNNLRQGNRQESFSESLFFYATLAIPTSLFTLSI